MSREVAASTHSNTYREYQPMSIYYSVYSISNKINGNIYIGAHETDNINDGYLGSGVLIKRAIKKYGKENFTKKILHICETREEMYSLEAQEIQKQQPDYNIHPGGHGGWQYVNENKMHVCWWNTATEEHKNRIKSELSKKHSGENNPMYGTSRTGEENPMFGKKHSAETKAKQSKAKLGKKHSEEVKINRSKATKKRWAEGKFVRKEQFFSEDARKKCGDISRGMFWWTNGIKSVRSIECPGPDFKRGRKKWSKNKNG